MSQKSRRKYGPAPGDLLSAHGLGRKALLVVALAGTEPAAATHGVPLYCACYDLTQRAARTFARGTCDSAAHGQHFRQGLLRHVYPSDPVEVVHDAPPAGMPCTNDGRPHYGCPRSKASATSLEAYMCVGMGEAEGPH